MKTSTVLLKIARRIAERNGLDQCRRHAILKLACGMRRSRRGYSLGWTLAVMQDYGRSLA